MADEALISRLHEAAASALADLGPVLKHELPKLKAVVIEVETANNGQDIGATAWVERKARVLVEPSGTVYTGAGWMTDA